MKFRTLVAAAFLLLGTSLFAQLQGDVLGSHNLSPNSSSTVQGSSSASCLYCHAPHSGIGGSTPLWAQSLSTQNYSVYTSSTVQNTGGQPIPGGASSLCLSCHDGTVAIGTLVPYGNATITGNMPTYDVFSGNLASSHPFSLNKPLKDSPDLVSSLAATGTTVDPQKKVKLINGTVECTSCHEPHMQNLDPVSLNFLVKDSSSGQLCLSCHEVNPRTVNGKVNPLAGWTNGVHSTSTNNVAASAKLGSYATVAKFACSSCHSMHNANATASLLRGYNPPPANMDSATMNCVVCHSGGSNLQQPLPNVYSQFTRATSHPYPTTGATHDPGEAGLLLNNRHSTCADCHNAHSSAQVLTFAPAPNVRPSQAGATGVSETDGTTVLTPATTQYQTCLRCHGTSTGKQSLAVYGYIQLFAASAADRLNVIPQFANTALSSHPVMHTSNSPWPQPSLLSYMLNLDGVTSSSRTLGATASDSILCSDCHNADDNREFGGSGASGPHGSQYLHILERRYEFAQVAPAAGPGSLIQNLFVNPNLNSGGSNPGPYALCGKCHNLSNIMADASFKPDAKSGLGGHFTHVSSYGLSCSVCHTSHGIGGTAAGIPGKRLVNFDLNVVAPNKGALSYNASGTCTLTCHGMDHDANGKVRPH